MNRSVTGTLRQALDDWRLRQHFRRVDAILRARDLSRLSPAQQQARAQYLDTLRAYARRGVFPRNYERDGCSPCFIDRDGRECAVAHLVMAAGQAELAQQIAAVDNYAHVPEMAFPELDAWAVESGFTQEELALIQPGYWERFDISLLTSSLVVWAVGIAVVAVNAWYVARKHKGVLVPVIGSVVGIGLLLSGLFFLKAAGDAYYLGTHADGWPGDLPLRDVPGLALIGSVDLGLAFAAGWLSIRRLPKFMSWFIAWADE